MANSLTSVTIVAENLAAAQADWARLGFAFLPGGVIALGSASIVLRDPNERPPAMAPLTIAMSERPNEFSAPGQHPNGARALAALAKAVENPADHGEALSRTAGQREMRATSAGLELKLENARWEVLTPPAFAQRYGAAEAEPAGQALVFTVADVAATRGFFAAEGIAFEERLGRLVLAKRLAGLVLAFEAQ